jgi:hypothetical protein
VLAVHRLQSIAAVIMAAVATYLGYQYAADHLTIATTAAAVRELKLLGRAGISATQL